MAELGSGPHRSGDEDRVAKQAARIQPHPHDESGALRPICLPGSLLTRAAIGVAGTAANRQAPRHASDTRRGHERAAWVGGSREPQVTQPLADWKLV